MAAAGRGEARPHPTAPRADETGEDLLLGGPFKGPPNKSDSSASKHSRHQTSSHARTQRRQSTSHPHGSHEGRGTATEANQGQESTTSCLPWSAPDSPPLYSPPGPKALSPTAEGHHLKGSPRAPKRPPQPWWRRAASKPSTSPPAHLGRVPAGPDAHRARQKPYPRGSNVDTPCPGAPAPPGPLTQPPCPEAAAGHRERDTVERPRRVATEPRGSPLRPAHRGVQGGSNHATTSLREVQAAAQTRRGHAHTPP